MNRQSLQRRHICECEAHECELNVDMTMAATWTAVSTVTNLIVRMKARGMVTEG